MKLKEFDLDLPKAERETRHAFRLQTRYLTALYERCFPGLNVEGGWKVLIECVESMARPEVRNLLGVFTLEAEFRHGQFVDADARGRASMVLEAIHGGAVRIAEAQGWPKKPFDTSKASVLDRSCVNEWSWPKPRWNAGRKYQAALACSHDAERFRAWLVVRDRKGDEVQREQVISELPSEFHFVPKMGKVVWVSQNHVVLLDKKSQEIGGLMVAAAGRT